MERLSVPLLYLLANQVKDLCAKSPTPHPTALPAYTHEHTRIETRNIHVSEYMSFNVLNFARVLFYVGDLVCVPSILFYRKKIHIFLYVRVDSLGRVTRVMSKALLSMRQMNAIPINI